MSARTPTVPVEADAIWESHEPETIDGAAMMQALVSAPASSAGSAQMATGVMVCELIGLADDNVALVRCSAGGDASVMRARSAVDLHGGHIGHSVVLVFENADTSRPIVMGLLSGQRGWPLADRPGQVEVATDGERLVVTAKEQLVLRCGKASITLTKAGKVLIEGAYVSSRSTGVNRVKGGSVQLN